MEGSPAAVYEYRRRGETLDVFRNAYTGTFLVAGAVPLGTLLALEGPSQAAAGPDTLPV